MVRFLVTAVIFFIVWRILRSFSGRTQPPTQPRQDRSARPPKKEYTDVQDAEFEDITPKDKPGGPKATP
jgi:hypothetical protein